jgi:hypothetical protein
MRVRAECSLFPGFKDVQQRLSDLVGIVSTQLGTSAQEVLKAKNHSAIAFLDISPGSRTIRARRQLSQLYRSSILPSSAFRPLGTYPPFSSPLAIAKSKQARSAPLWPPDMIFRRILCTSSLHRFQLRGLPVNPSVRKSSEFEMPESQARRE